MTLMLRIAFAVGLLVVPLQLRAGYLGHSVELTFEKPQNIAVPIGLPPPPPSITGFGVTTAGFGVEFSNAIDWDVDVSETSIRFALGGPEFNSHWALPISFGFQGFRLRDADGTLPDIVGVSAGSDSHVGLDPSKISFDADNVLVDMTLFIETGFQFSPTTGIVRAFQPEFVLNVVFAEVPEPATAAMMGAALIALVGVRRRQNRR